MNEIPKNAPKSEKSLAKPPWWKNRLMAAALAVTEFVNLYHPKEAKAFDERHLVAERAPMSERELQVMVDQLQHPENFLEQQEAPNAIAKFSFGSDRVDGRLVSVQSDVHMEQEGRLADLIDDGAISVTVATATYHEQKVEDRTSVAAHTRDTVQIRENIESIPADASHRIESRGELIEKTGSGATLDGAISAALMAIATETAGGPMDHAEGQEGYFEGSLAVSGRPNVDTRTEWRYGLTIIQHAQLNGISVQVVSSPDPNTHQGLYQVSVRAHKAVVVATRAQ
ncbi:MAG: hypothetical protein WCK01_04695 [Candidatus Uhrbacteria bacterium]